MVIFEHYLVSNLIEQFVEDFCSFYFEILLICLDVPLFLFFQNQCLLVKTFHLYFLLLFCTTGRRLLFTSFITMYIWKNNHGLFYHRVIQDFHLILEMIHILIRSIWWLWYVICAEVSPELFWYIWYSVHWFTVISLDIETNRLIDLVDLV